MSETKTVRKKKKFAEEPNFTEKKTYRPEGARETGLAFVGHEISEDGNVMNQFLHYDQLYTIRHGWNSKFFKGLLEGKIWGTRCPKCGDAWVPVRTHCWNLDCNLQRTEWVEMPTTGVLHAWTVCGFSAKSALKKLPFVLAYVLVGESKTAIANILHIKEPWHTETNMPVIIKMAPEEDRVGNLIDFWFEPDPSWKPSEDRR